MADSVQFTSLLDRMALDYLKDKRLKQGFSHYNVWLHEHAINFTVAKMMDADLLAETQSALADALQNGTDLATFKQRLKPYLMAKGWWGESVMTDPKDGIAKTVQLGSTRRLRMIFQTNTATAYAAGQWARIQEDAERFPYMKYIASTAEHKRQSHTRFYGKIWRTDDPIWHSIFPPNGYGCQCTVRQLSAKQALRERGEDIARQPEQFTPQQIANQQHGIIDDGTDWIEWRNFTNPRTGQTVRVPFDVSPSFAHNPADKLGALQQLMADKHGVTAARALQKETADYVREKIERPNFIGKHAPNLTVIDDGGIANAQELIWGHAGRGYQLGETIVGQPFSYEHFQQGQTNYLLSYLPDGVELIKIPQKELQQLKQLEMQQLLSKLVNDNDRDYLQRHMEQLLAANFGQADLADKLAGYLYTTNGGYMTVNPALIRVKRNLNLLEPQELQAIHAIDEFLAKSPKYIGKATRKVRTATMSDAAAFIQAHSKGSIIRYSNFTSTSKPSGSFGGSASDVVLTIHGKSGVDISALSRFHHEGEVLMPRHAVYQVKSYELRDGCHYVELEEIDESAEIRGRIIQLSGFEGVSKCPC